MVANYRKKPYGVRTGTVTYPQFFLPPGPKTIKVGELVLEARDVDLRTSGGTWLRIKQSDDPAGPVLISAYFKNENSASILRLDENILSAYPTHGFDVCQQAASIEFSVNGSPVLSLDRSDNAVMQIKHAESWFGGYHIQIMKSGIYVNQKLVFGGGDLQILGNGQLIFNLDQMYKS